MVKEKEYEIINSIRGALMILVVSGHFLQIIEWSSPEQIKLILRTIVLLIYSFHMPLFIGLSGYLSKNPDKRREKAFKDLLLPYFIFQIIFGILQTSKQVILGGVIQNIFIPQFGLWYLLVLFIYRILLKDILNIKYICIYAIVTNICTCFFEFSKEFSLYRVFGFLVFFLLGYYYSKNDNSKYKVKIINRGIAISVLVIESVIIGFLCINLSSEKYDNLLDILCHRIVYTDYDAWYLAPLIYFIALLIALLNSWLFISIFQKPFKFSKYVGKDALWSFCL